MAPSYHESWSDLISLELTAGLGVFQRHRQRLLRICGDQSRSRYTGGLGMARTILETFAEYEASQREFTRRASKMAGSIEETSKRYRNH
jgi:hypothetical protein